MMTPYPMEGEAASHCCGAHSGVRYHQFTCTNTQ